MAELRYTDLFLVNRDYESYKVTGEAFYATYLNKPKIFNINLLEVNPGALPRFTNQSFVSRTTMEDEGQPLSSKIYDAYVEGTILDDISTSVITDTNTLVDKASGVVVEVAGNFGQTGTPADLFDGSVNNFGVSQWYVDLPSIPFDNALGGVMVQGAKSISEQWSQYFYRVTGTNVPSGWWCLGAEGPGVTSWNNINTGDFPWALNNGSNVFKITGPTGTGVITKIEFMYSTTSGPSSDGSVSGTPVLATTNRVLQAAIFVNQEILLDGVELTVTDDTNLDQFVVGKEVIQNSSGTPETSAITNVVNDKNALGQITYVTSNNTDSVQNAFNGESSGAMWMIYTNGVGSTSQRVELTNPINNTTGYVVVWTYNALGPQGSPNPQNQVLWVNGTPITFTATTSGINPYLVPVSTGPISNIGLGFASAANMNVSAFDLNATDIPSAKPLYLNPNDYSTLTLTNDTNLANFQVGDAVDKGTVSAIDTLNTQMDVVLTDTADVYVPTDTVTGPTLTAKGNLLRVYEADNKILVNNSTGRFFETKPEQTLNRLDKTAVQENVPVDGTKKYLEFSESGTVTGLLDAPQSPAYVTTDEDPVLTLTFPSTFPSGFTPDEELGEGVTLTIEVTAENVVGTDGPKSATVQPEDDTPIDYSYLNGLTALYTGNPRGQWITTGIDLVNNDGLVWIKNRTGNNDHALTDTLTGPSQYLHSNKTDAIGGTAFAITSFLEYGFQLGTDSSVNGEGYNFAAWTFSKVAGYFDIHNPKALGPNDSITLNHNLGTRPGLIIVKPTTIAGGWLTWHTSFSAGDFVRLDRDTAKTAAGGEWVSNITDSSITLDNEYMYGNNTDLIVYLFAEDTPDVIKCGTYVGTQNDQNIDVGFEAQWVLIKSPEDNDNWLILDNKRGNYAELYPNDSKVEAGTAGSSGVKFTNPNGFAVDGGKGNCNANGRNYIYVAIAAPPAARSLTAEELDAQKLKFLTYNNRKDVVCGEEASAARATLLATLTEAGYTEADINQTYSNLDN